MRVRTLKLSTLLLIALPIAAAASSPERSDRGSGGVVTAGDNVAPQPRAARTDGIMLAQLRDYFDTYRGGRCIGRKEKRATKPQPGVASDRAAPKPAGAPAAPGGSAVVKPATGSTGLRDYFDPYRGGRYIGRQDRRGGGAAAARAPVMRAPDRRSGTHHYQWPEGVNAFHATRNDIFATRPDLWGDVVLAAAAGGEDRVAAPEVETAPRIDGRLSEGEWNAAGESKSTSLTGTAQMLRVVRTHDALHIALVHGASTRLRSDQVLEVFIDPQGDEGLLPRPDDRCLRFTHEGGRISLEAFSWNEKRKGWDVAEKLRFDAAAPSAGATEDGAAAIELSIPFREIGCAPNGPGQGATIGLAMRVTVEMYAGR